MGAIFADHVLFVLFLQTVKPKIQTVFNKTKQMKQILRLMPHATFNLILFMLALGWGIDHSVKTYSKNKMSYHVQLLNYSNDVP